MEEKISIKVLGKRVDKPQSSARSAGDRDRKEEFNDKDIRVRSDVSYELTSKRDGARQFTETLRNKDAIALTLDDGHVVWLPAEDLPKLLDVKRGEEVVIGASTQLRLQTAQRGPVAFGIKMLRFLGFDIEEKAAESLTDWVSSRVEGKVGGETAVYRCLFQPRGLEFDPKERNRISPGDPDQPVLVMLHGTASSTSGSFAHLWGRHEKSWKALVHVDTYGDEIYALEHRTLTESPIENACVLLDALEHKGQVVHLVSHSRGGIVGELLCRSMVQDDEPLKQSEIDWIVKRYSDEEAQVRVRKSLEKLARKLREKRPRIERFVRVACPARGTGLADERLDLFFNMLLWGAEKLSGLLPGDADLIADLAGSIRTILMRAIKNRFDARMLPGLECMVPGTPLQTFMNSSPRKLHGELAVVAGDADVALNPLQAIATALLNLYYGEPNDWVVETQSMTGGFPRLTEPGYLPSLGGKVNHFSYFENDATAPNIIRALKSGAENAEFQTRSVPELLTASKRGDRIRAVDRPTVFFLPGFPGSHLRHSQEGRVWLDAGIITGDLSYLDIRNDHETIEPEALVNYFFSSSPYGRFVRHLGRNYRVEAFPYDWRQGMDINSERLAERIEKALDEEEGREFPLHIVCHSMGGLVALYTILTNEVLWNRICEHPGSKLILAGTPVQGTFNTVQLLTGSHGLVRFAAGVDQCSRHEELIGIFRQFPGLLQSLPRWGGNRKFFAADYWESLRNSDRRGFPWAIPDESLLDQVEKTARVLDREPLNSGRIHYVAGTDDETPSGTGFSEEGELIFTTLDRADGDGLALWEESIPDYAQSWVIPDVEHGSLFDDRRYFPLYEDLLQKGASSRLEPGKPRRRDLGTARKRDIVERPVWIEPDADDVLRAMMAGKLHGHEDETRRPAAVPRVNIIHGNMKNAGMPMIVSHYEGDSINGTEGVMNAKLDGVMEKRLSRGDYPGPVNSVEIFTRSGQPDETAIVVGLGHMGMLTGPKLRQTFSNALVRFSLHRQEQAGFSGQEAGSPEVGSLIIGSGVGALPLQHALIALLRGLVDANRMLQAISAPLYKELSFIELYEDSAIQAARVLENLVKDFDGVLDLNPVVECGKGGISARYSFQSDPWWRIVRIQQMDDTMVFTPVGDRGASPSLTKVNQQNLVDAMVESAIENPSEQSRLGMALFEVLIPHDYKEDVADQQGVQLLVDEASARFPWEMLQDRDNRAEEPVAVQTGVVRQLTYDQAQHFREFNRGNKALIIADTLGDLEGARKEAQVVRSMLNGNFDVQSWVRPGQDQVTNALADLLIKDYRILHFATHGICLEEDAEQQWKEENENALYKPYSERSYTTALVLGEDLYLEPGMLESVRRIPELVFINCCHLARIDERDEEHARGRNILAASISSAFLKLGARAVIAAGWAVDDDAAEHFARVFYDCMLERQKTFGEAVTEARSRTWKRFPGSNTWAAYQCYGEASFRLVSEEKRDPCPSPVQFHAPGEFESWLRDFTKSCSVKDQRAAIEARLGRATSAEKAWIESEPGIQEALGHLYADVGEFKKATGYFNAALEDANGVISLKGVEQACNISTRWVEQMMKFGDRPGDQEIEEINEVFLKAIRRLEGLLMIDENMERLNLLGSAYKHLAIVRQGMRRGNRAAIIKDLATARDYYYKADELHRGKTGKSHSYPALNAIVLDALLYRLDLERRTDMPLYKLRAILDQLDQDIPPDSLDFWMRTDRVNIRMVRMLVDREFSIDQADALAEAYSAEFVDASARHRDSVVKQIRFIRQIIDFFPARRENTKQFAGFFTHLSDLLLKES